MDLFDRLKNFRLFGNAPEPTALSFDRGGTYYNYHSYSFNGEKNLGEVGPIRYYIPDYMGLRARSWQALIESEVVQTIIYKMCAWVIGGGLKLTSEPAKDILKDEGVNFDPEVFSKQTEQRFNLFRNSRESDYSGMSNLDELANIAELNAMVGGDVLTIVRFDGKNVTVQLIDGEYVQSPLFGTEAYPRQLENGNQLIDGIEYDAKKRHVRYYIRNAEGKYDVIEAFGKKTGLQVAFMVKGMGYRMDNLRGIPLISAVLEKIKKMERYDSATLGSAEERQKISFYIKHEKNSTGETPLQTRMARVMKTNAKEDVPATVDGKQLADTIAASTNKTVFNMPLDSDLKSLESKSELYYGDYYTTNLISVCAAVNMPYQVAMSLYEGNFSASRAALKDWENTLKILRKRFADQFYQPIFNFWLEMQILQNKIPAPGYLAARMKGNTDIVNAYRKCRFTGSNVPHIDPLKEVMAVREALGSAADHLPLITLEEATELLNGSESRDNVLQFANELKEAAKLKIERPLQPRAVPQPPDK